MEKQNRELKDAEMLRRAQGSWVFVTRSNLNHLQTLMWSIVSILFISINSQIICH